MPNTSKILIVDDDAELRDALTDQLSLYEEFETVVAENGTKAVQTAKAVQIDLVIMDRDGNLSAKDLANALPPFAQRDPEVHWTRPPCGRALLSCVAGAVTILAHYVSPLCQGGSTRRPSAFASRRGRLAWHAANARRQSKNRA
jgi:Response regulator receiver domain